jgi:phosphoribosylglycinamide formyltransferase-1
LARALNLIADLDDPRFAQSEVHRALEALPARGVRPIRDHRTPEPLLSWIDAEFGGTWSSEAAAGGVWVAEDSTGRLGFAAFDPRALGFFWLRYWRQKNGVGVFGPFGLVEGARKTGLGPTLLRATMFSLRERGYRQALIPLVFDQKLVSYYEREAGARVVESVDLGRGQKKWRATILASGNGSNFEAVVERAKAGAISLDVRALIVSRGDAFALERARRLGVAAAVVAWERGRESRESYDVRLLDAVAATEPDVVLLLGWLHVLSMSFVTRFPQLVNLHPAFLPLDPALDGITMPDGSVIPAFRGIRAVDDALAAGVGWIGATAHRVGVAVDRGDVLARRPLRLVDGEPRSALDARLHSLEHEVVAIALRRWSWEQP